MGILVKDILKAIDSIAPWDLSESWDNSGLQVGDPDSVVTRLGIALDVTPEIIEESVAQGIDCLLTHHPFLFKSLKIIDFSSIEGRIIQKAAKSGLSIISAHTNFDIAKNGLNDILAEKIGLFETYAMTGIKKEFESDKSVGIGRVGFFRHELTLFELSQNLKQILGLKHLRYVGKPDQILRKAAICTGSGGSLIRDFFNSGADVYVSGDIKYHEARDAEARGKAIVDIGHFGSEILVVEALAERLRKYFTASGGLVEIIEITLEKEPFVFL